MCEKEQQLITQEAKVQIFFGLKPGAKIDKLHFQLKWKKNIESFQDRMKNADLVVVTRDLKNRTRFSLTLKTESLK